MESNKLIGYAKNNWTHTVTKVTTYGIDEIFELPNRTQKRFPIMKDSNPDELLVWQNEEDRNKELKRLKSKFKTTFNE